MKKYGYLSGRLGLLPTGRRLMHPHASMTLGGGNWLTRSARYLRIISAELGHKIDSTGFEYLRRNAVFGLQLLQKPVRIQVRVQNCVLPLDG